MTIPPLRTWSLELPFTKPLSLNDRMHWRVKASHVRNWRIAAGMLARQQRIPPCARIAVTLTYVPRDDRRRDEDNLVGTYKPVMDGLVDAGIVPDDTKQYVDRTWPVIAEKGPAGPAGGRLFLRVEELAE